MSILLEQSSLLDRSTGADPVERRFPRRGESGGQEARRGTVALATKSEEKNFTPPLMQSNAPPVLIVDHGDSLKVRAESTKQKAAKTKKNLSHWQIGRREGFVCLELIMIKIKSACLRVAKNNQRTRD